MLITRTRIAARISQGAAKLLVADRDRTFEDAGAAGSLGMVMREDNELDRHAGKARGELLVEPQRRVQAERIDDDDALGCDEEQRVLRAGVKAIQTVGDRFDGALGLEFGLPLLRTRGRWREHDGSDEERNDRAHFTIQGEPKTRTSRQGRRRWR